MKRWTLLIFILIIGLIFFGIGNPRIKEYREQQAALHTELRAAMDIGSGSTNLKIASVNLKTDKIEKVVFEQSIPVPYQKHLEQSKDNTFDPPVMQQGIEAINKLKIIADSYHVKKIVAVATAAFRQASNAHDYARDVEANTGVKVRIINQDEEGILAFRGALALTTVDPQKAVVWDIGGGSMQLTTLSNEGTYLVDKGKTASIPFKNAIIQEIKRENPLTVTSPNPMNPEQMQSAIKLSEKYALQTDPFIKSKIADAKTSIIAVGSLFNYGILPLVNAPQGVTFQKLEKATMQMADKGDKELPGGSLAEVAVSNPILVLGYLQGLNIPSIDIVSVNNADGALTYPAYWQ